MHLWWCHAAKVNDWGSYVIAETRNEAKMRFMWIEDTDYIDVRAQKIKPADGFEAALLDCPDCWQLAALGVKYPEDEEGEWY